MSYSLTFTARQGGQIGTGAVTIGVTAPPAGPLLIASSARAPYAGLPFHLYLGSDLVGPDGVPPPDVWPTLVNIDARTRGMSERDRQLWVPWANGDWDAELQQAASKATIMTVLHEPNTLQGSAPEFCAAITHAYDVVKAANPRVLTGPCLLGNWADPGFQAPDGSRLSDWLAIPMDFLGCDRYPVATGKDFDTLLDPWFRAAGDNGVPLLVCETAASTGHAQEYYDSTRKQAPAHPREELLGVTLWLSFGPRGDYRPSALTAVEQDSLLALASSPAFGRSL